MGVCKVRPLSSTVVIVLALIVSVFPAAKLRAQPPVQVAITEPSNGTVVYPGNIMTVKVQASVVVGGILLGGDLLRFFPNFKNVKATAPYDFQMAIPQNLPTGAYTLTAFGRTAAGAMIQSSPVKILIETTEHPSSLKVEPSSILLSFRGEEIPVDIYGQRSDGTYINYNLSTRLLCQSTAPSVVQVKPPCIAIAVSPGSGSLTVQRGAASSSVRVQVNALAVRGDFDTDGDVDNDDVSQLTLWRNQPSAPTGDDRDLNSDGKIDALDVRVLTTMCTRPRCAIQ